jgi:hypothetical protein
LAEQTDPPPAAPQRSQVVVTFGGPGQADPVIAAEGVSLGQIMSAAFLLDAWAHELRAQAAAGQLPGGLAVIRGGLPDLGGSALRRRT